MLERVLDDYQKPWRKYADFSGRASRAEFWTFTLINALMSLVLSEIWTRSGMPLAFSDMGYPDLLFQIAVFLPGITVATRRLHDVDKSGWWQLIALVPLIGVIILFFDFIGRPSRGANRYGSNPYGDPVVVWPEDGGAPYAQPVGRFAGCPHCGKRNPLKRSSCQWCYKEYREPAGPI